MMNKNKDFTQNDEYTLGFERSDVSPCAHIQTENIELEVEPEEISLNSFQKKNHLAPKLWNGTKLDSNARLTLMDIADDFWDFCKIRWTDVEDVILVGSICNFNWSEFSDIDVHLVVDFGKVHTRKDFVQEYFNEKKNEWNNSHTSLKIFGYPVELYVQDIDAKVESGGVFDLWENRWISEPNESMLKPIELNKYAIKKLSARLITQIDDLIDAFKIETDNHKIEVLDNEASNLIQTINTVRKNGLKDGEMGVGNIVYKCLRRSGRLDKLWKLKEKAYDKLNSIEESISFSHKIKQQFFTD